MNRRTNTSKKSIDWVVLSVYFSLVVIGWFMVFSTLYNEQNPTAFLDVSTPLGAQTLWVFISIVAFLFTLTIDWKFWNTIAYPLYGLTLGLLVLVLLVGKEINGAKAWFSFGFFSFQPAEWAKFATALAVASYLSFYKKAITETQVFLLAVFLFLGPALLILLQPDFGSSLVFFSFFLLLYRRGMSPLWLIIGLSGSAIFVCSLVFSPQSVIVFLVSIAVMILCVAAYQNFNGWLISLVVIGVSTFLLLQGEWVLAVGGGLLVLAYFFMVHFQKGNYRIGILVFILLFLSAGFSFGTSYVFDCDPRGSLYNLIQSKLAIGSGGFAGKGFLQGEMTKLNYVPEQSTDFIFTTIGEEQGFIGSLGVILLFTILLVRCIFIAERSHLEFIRNYGYAVAGILLVHFTFNLGMTMGILPVVGIPLPFISKGGSSLLAFSMMVGVLLKMDMARYRTS